VSLPAFLRELDPKSLWDLAAAIESPEAILNMRRCSDHFRRVGAFVDG
jgi:hypothetical protein